MPIDFNKCLYLNAERDNADSMLKECINGPNELDWPCIGKVDIDKDILNIVTERPSGDNKGGNLPHSLNSLSHDLPDKGDQALYGNPNIEGFTNMGESYVIPGDCPDGHFWCTKSNKCKPVCINCKYNERTYGKSKEFNEADACFPNKGVYNGINNQGQTQCTCGSRGQYCNEMFNAQGGMFADNVFIMNVGDFGPLGSLASY